MKYSLVVFDFDGTLVDSARCITTSIERALTAHGCACDAGSVREHIGLPLEAIIRGASAGIGDAVIEPVIAAYRREYAALETELIALFPGAHDAIEALHEEGVTLAVATNKLTERARVTLDRLGVAGRFSTIAGCDRVRNPKPHPDLVLHVMDVTGGTPAATLVVGDTTWDIEMATRAGVASCAVTWGNHDAARLARAQPSHSADSFAALRKLLQTVES